MSWFQVKMCGITRPRDAARVADLGGDMIGMIFYKNSPRCINLARAREIVAVLPSTVDRVGLFVNGNEDQMLRTAEKLKLDYLQLHGDESAATVRRLQKAGFKVIKAFGIASALDWEIVKKSKADLVLADNRSAELAGGTGESFDWGLVPKIRIPNLVLAGGINADNLEEGLRLFHPHAVDVNSGVESSPGVKSDKKLKQFFQLCNRLRGGQSR